MSYSRALRAGSPPPRLSVPNIEGVLCGREPEMKGRGLAVWVWKPDAEISSVLAACARGEPRRGEHVAALLKGKGARGTRRVRGPPCRQGVDGNGDNTFHQMGSDREGALDGVRGTQGTAPSLPPGWSLRDGLGCPVPGVHREMASGGLDGECGLFRGRTLP